MAYTHHGRNVAPWFGKDYFQALCGKTYEPLEILLFATVTCPACTRAWKSGKRP